MTAMSKNEPKFKVKKKKEKKSANQEFLIFCWRNWGWKLGTSGSFAPCSIRV